MAQKISKIQAAQQEHLLQVLNNQKLCDVTFIIGADKVKFRVNRIFLAVISPVFEAMLCGNMIESKPNSDVIIPDIDPDAFECILKYAYFNDPELTAHNICNVKYICDKYQIETLSQHLGEKWRSILNCNNFLIALHNAVQLKYKSFTKQCTDYLKALQTQTGTCNRYSNYRYPRREFVSQIIKSDSFLNLGVDGMKVLLSLDEFAASEDKIWPQLLKWSEYQTQKVLAPQTDDDADDEKQSEDEKQIKYKLSLLKSVKSHVRFGLMSPTYFACSVVPQMVLDDQEMIAIFTYICGNTSKGCGHFCVKKRDGV